MSRKPVINIIGSGIAGLSAALRLKGYQVRIITTGQCGQDGASWMAKGGISAALADDDRPALHARDTLKAGAGLCELEAVQHITQAAPELIDWLIALGVNFDAGEKGLKLGLEGAHCRNRIVHADGDNTGRAVMQVLAEHAKQAKHIQWFEHSTAVELVRDHFGIQGVWINTQDGDKQFLPGLVVIASGGLGQLFEKTTNPTSAWGSGLYLAMQIGAATRHLEFVQFHPTALDLPSSQTLPLMTEALRGAGAILINEDGQRFMPRYHELLELAPRHVVSQSIWQEQQAGRKTLLDATALHAPSINNRFQQQFPSAYELCMQNGIDPTRQPIPVTPAAHYHMGGVITDLDGHTSINGLYACGEVASTGLHGANRLASNSLLEGLVCGRDIALAIQQRNYRPQSAHPESPADLKRSTVNEDLILRIRKIMWHSAGLIRNRQSLNHGLKQLCELIPQTQSFQARVMLELASEICRCALKRKNSVGAHWRSDADQTLKRQLISQRAIQT